MNNWLQIEKERIIHIYANGRCTQLQAKKLSELTEGHATEWRDGDGIICRGDILVANGKLKIFVGLSFRSVPPKLWVADADNYEKMCAAYDAECPCPPASEPMIARREREKREAEELEALLKNPVEIPVKEPSPDTEEKSADDLSNLSYAELRALAKERGILNFHLCKKAELIEILS